MFLCIALVDLVVLWPGVWAEDGITVAVSIALDAPALDAQAGRWRMCSSALDLSNLKVALLAANLA